ncbi:MAG: lysophospholipid acyltransferase family protein, partial [Bacilli bacterium]
MFYVIVRGILIPIAKLYNRMSVINKEKIPSYGPYIVVANHVSYVDPIYIGLLLPLQLRFMAKAESFKKPLLKWILTHLGAF